MGELETVQKNGKLVHMLYRFHGLYLLHNGHTLIKTKYGYRRPTLGAQPTKRTSKKGECEIALTGVAGSRSYHLSAPATCSDSTCGPLSWGAPPLAPSHSAPLLRPAWLLHFAPHCKSVASGQPGTNRCVGPNGPSCNTGTTSPPHVRRVHPAVACHHFLHVVQVLLRNM